MNNFIEYIKGINILLVVLDILLLIISFLFFSKRNYSSTIKDLFVICYTLANMFLFSYLNSIFQGIFTLNYLNVKFYLITVLFVLIILLYTLNKKVKFIYKLFNYLVFILTIVIFIFNIYVSFGGKIEIGAIYFDNSIKLMNVSCIVFFIYLLLMSLGWICYYVCDMFLMNKQSNFREELTNDVSNKEKKVIIKGRKIKENKLKIAKKVDINENKKEVASIDDKENNSFEKLLSYKVGDSFYINGVDCSIIFCDSNKENIVKNYEILSSNINAKLVNGYTLEENIMIREICYKLNVSNLASVDINNFSILNLISVDEYVFLKKVLSEN